MAVDKYADLNRPWSWSSQPRPLGLYKEAPERYGFYEIGYWIGGEFKPKYGGRAAGTTLRQRLRKHFQGSHNPHIQAEAPEGRLWYRYRVLDSRAEARFVEALQVIAFEKDYEWNDRQEWTQHWALER